MPDLGSGAERRGGSSPSIRTISINMNVTFDKKDELNASISVSIEPNDFTASYEKKLKDYGKKANIPGFRAGQAPKGVIEKMVGQSILLEEVNGLASKGLFDYIEENKLHVLGQPVMSEDTKIDELSKTASYTFSFDIGLAPEFELNISSADSYPFYTVNVTDEMVNDELNRLRKQMGVLTDVEEVGENDMVYVQLNELLDSGEVLEGGVNAPSVPLAINTIKDEVLNAQIRGLKKGETIKVNIFTLFNHDEMEMSHALGVQKQGVPDLGKEFNLTLNEIKRTTESEMNQEFFDKIYGKDQITTEEELRTKLSAEIKGYFDQQANHLLEHELFDSLVAKHNISLPDATLKRWLIDRHADKFNADNIEEGYIPEANYLRNHLLEEKILVSNDLKIDEEEIRNAAKAYTMQMFGGYNMGNLSDDILNSIIEPQMQKEEFRSRMINVAARNKVNDYLLNTITKDIKEVSVEEFNAIIAEHNGKHHHNH